MTAIAMRRRRIERTTEYVSGGMAFLVNLGNSSSCDLNWRIANIGVHAYHASKHAEMAVCSDREILNRSLHAIAERRAPPRRYRGGSEFNAGIAPAI